MPIYMDRHDVPGITRDEVASAHKMDLMVQEEFDCVGMTYWHDEDRGCAFCLVRAPHAEAVHEMHRKAHGLVPNEIIEVDEVLVEAFLGRIHDPVSADSADEPVSADRSLPYRTLLLADLTDAALLPSLYGRKVNQILLDTFHQVFAQTVDQFRGKVVDSRKGLMASFGSVTRAVDCAIQFQDEVRESILKRGLPLPSLKTGLSAGAPVTADNPDLFGDTLNLVRKLQFIASNGIIQAGSEIREFYSGQGRGIFEEPERIHVQSENQEAFLLQFLDLVGESLTGKWRSVSEIGREMGLSNAQLYRKSEEVTAASPKEIIQEARLARSLEMLSGQSMNVSEVSHALSFSSPSYFSKCFKERYGIPPTEYLKSI